jgi:putative modified peptide
MADSKLSREHSLALLQKLATDDAYRARYEEKPAAALAELGVPHETIVNLKASCLTVSTLAEKDHFQSAHTQLLNASANTCLQMIVPSAKIDFASGE